MIGQDPSGLLDFASAQAAELLAPVQAKIQAEVGLFLADKAFLVDAQRRATTPQLQAQAQQLYQEQTELEATLGRVLPPIQSGTYDLSTVSDASAFLAQMEMHRSAVNDLRRAMGVAPATVGFDWNTIMVYGGGALAFLGIASRSVLPLLAGAGLAGYGLYSRRAA
jgi:hypothetical protein